MSWMLLSQLSINEGHFLELFFKFPLSYKEKRIKSLVRASSTVMEREGRYSKIISVLLLHRYSDLFII